jgi:hypothetical protein
MNFKHILSQSGVMKTISIACRVSEADVKLLTLKYSRMTKKNISLPEYMRREVGKKMQEAFANHKVPGLIFDESEPTNEEHQQMMALTQFSSLVAKKLIEKDLEKFYYCFVIHSIVNMIGLTDEDFADFHNKFSKFRGEGDDNEDDS